MSFSESILKDHADLTRRFFIGFGAASLASLASRRAVARADESASVLTEAVFHLDSFMIAPGKFNDVSRGSPVPHLLIPHLLMSSPCHFGRWHSRRTPSKTNPRLPGATPKGVEPKPDASAHGFWGHRQEFVFPCLMNNGEQ